MQRLQSSSTESLQHDLVDVAFPKLAQRDRAWWWKLCQNFDLCLQIIWSAHHIWSNPILWQQILFCIASDQMQKRICCSMVFHKPSQASHTCRPDYMRFHVVLRCLCRFCVNIWCSSCAWWISLANHVNWDPKTIWRGIFQMWLFTSKFVFAVIWRCSSHVSWCQFVIPHCDVTVGFPLASINRSVI